MGKEPINFTVILVPWCLCGWTNNIKVSFPIRLAVFLASGGADTWHLHFASLNKQRACFPAGATFSERRLAKSLVSNYWNHIMFAHDLYHCRIEYFRNAIDLNWKDRAKRYNKSSIFNSPIKRDLRFAATGLSRLGSFIPCGINGRQSLRIGNRVDVNVRGFA